MIKIKNKNTEINTLESLKKVKLGELRATLGGINVPNDTFFNDECQFGDYEGKVTIDLKGIVTFKFHNYKTDRMNRTRIDLMASRFSYKSEDSSTMIKAEDLFAFPVFDVVSIFIENNIEYNVMAQQRYREVASDFEYIEKKKEGIHYKGNENLCYDPVEELFLDKESNTDTVSYKEIYSEELTFLDEILPKLTSKQQSVIQLRRSGKCNTEIAEEMGVTKQSVQENLDRAQNNIQQAYLLVHPDAKLSLIDMSKYQKSKKK